MLDTRMPSTSSRPRRSSSSAQPERLHVRPSHGPAAVAPVRENIQEEPVRRALPSARSNRLSRSEMRLMGIATVCTAVVCALLLLYLAAYAQVTQLGIAQAGARTDLHRNQMRHQLLEAECNALESPQRITVAAVAEGLVPRGQTPVNYIAAPPRIKVVQEKVEEAQEKVEETQEASAQGNSTGGTTKDSRTAASFGY